MSDSRNPINRQIARGPRASDWTGNEAIAGLELVTCAYLGIGITTVELDKHLCRYFYDDFDEGARKLNRNTILM